MTIVAYAKSILALIGAGVGWYFGGADNTLIILLVLVILDYCTGVIAAVINKCLCSDVGLRGIMKKVFIFILIGVANLVDNTIFQNAVPLNESVTFFYIANEAISIAENAGRIGLPLPPKFKEILINLEKDQHKK